MRNKNEVVICGSDCKEPWNCVRKPCELPEIIGSELKRCHIPKTFDTSRIQELVDQGKITVPDSLLNGKKKECVEFSGIICKDPHCTIPGILAKEGVVFRNGSNGSKGPK